MFMAATHGRVTLACVLFDLFREACASLLGGEASIRCTAMGV